MDIETAPRPSETTGNARLSKRLKSTIVAVALLLVAVIGYVLWPTSTAYRPMESSYGYDVSNLRILCGQADNIVIAKVLGVSAVDESLGTTSFTVEVQDTIKGDLTGRQVVEQLGFVEKTLKTNTIIEDPDQPLLKPGTEVLLTLGSVPGTPHFVIGGPRSVVVLGSGTQRQNLREERANAARNAQPVRDGNGQVVMPVKDKLIR